MFDADNAHRRRSSLVTTDNPNLAYQSPEGRQDTACFVHSLLEKQRRARLPKGQNSQHINEDSKADKAAGLHDGNATHSRLLTKRQLSDMALGVRELSKRLGSVRLKLRVKTVFLLTKAHDEGLIGYTREVVEWLLSKDRATPYIVYVHRVKVGRASGLMSCSYVEDILENNDIFDTKSIMAKDSSREGRLKYWNIELCKKHPLTFDFVVTVATCLVPQKTQLT